MGKYHDCTDSKVPRNMRVMLVSMLCNTTFTSPARIIATINRSYVIIGVAFPSSLSIFRICRKWHTEQSLADGISIRIHDLSYFLLGWWSPFNSITETHINWLVVVVHDVQFSCAIYQPLLAHHWRVHQCLLTSRFIAPSIPWGVSFTIEISTIIHLLFKNYCIQYISI